MAGMTLFFTITLVLSLFGMGALLALKHFEMTTGRIVFGGARPGIGAFFHRCLVWVEHSLPSFVDSLVRQSLTVGKRVLHYTIAHTVLVAEHTLEKVLHLLRHTTTHPAPGSGQVSTFLREVAEHKKKLIKRSSSRTLIP